MSQNYLSITHSYLEVCIFFRALLQENIATEKLIQFKCPSKLFVQAPRPHPHTQCMLKTDNFLRRCFVIKYCDKTPLYLGVPSVFTCVLGAQHDHLIETLL